MTTLLPPVDPVPTVDEFGERLIRNLYQKHGSATHSASDHDVYMALAYTVRDFLMQRLRRTTDAQYATNPRFAYYLSAEYLLGKQLEKNLLYTGTSDVAREALARLGLGVDLDRVLELDVEPGLGNGGLGRLASCYMDSLATLDMPATGYGIRYEFGIFRQTFVDGWQVERPDAWALRGNPWEFIQSDQLIQVGFGGRVEHHYDAGGAFRVRWIPASTVLGEPCTQLVPGYGTTTVNILRLWRARASEEFDFQQFNEGDYEAAVHEKVASETLTKVLYPNDASARGKELRLKQHYFFVACSLRDILRRFHLRNRDLRQLPEKVVIQLNDTHPVVAIPELMRLLLDEHELGWDEAWAIVRSTFAYTCHTLLPEALEKWPVALFGRLLPRHLEIVYEINRRLLDEVRSRFPGDEARVIRMSLIENGGDDWIRMANLAIVGGFAVNGVAALHSRLLREATFRDFAEMWPGRFKNKTNGVTPRRFIRLSNPGLSRLITDTLGTDAWITDLGRLAGLEAHLGDAGFRQRWREVKQQNKTDLAARLHAHCGITVAPDSLFDVMAKRLHEYKRQLLKVLHIVWLYHRVKADPAADITPRTFLFGAKAAPGYYMAKQIIRLVNGVAEVVNQDADVRGRLRVAFLPNFNVSLGERLYPAADLSEQISLAGKEASGTGNMKLALNGAITVGTLDGANVEIRDLVGDDNFFLFGLTEQEAVALKSNGYAPRLHYDGNPELRGVIDAIASGVFSRGDASLFRPIVDSLLGRDEYLHLADFAPYVECSERAAAAWTDADRWTRMSILNVARCGFFSSDRSIREYCADIWQVTPLVVP